MRIVSSDTSRRGVFIAAGLTGLCVLAYARALTLPLISDDFGCIETARRYGWVNGWSDLLRDPLYRCRALSNVIGYWLFEWGGLQPLVYNVASLLLHVLNTLLVAALGLWRPIGARVSIPAAAFFAVAEGHQEAVIWFAALPDLNVFTFTLIGFLAWVLWLQDGCRSVLRYGMAMGSFTVALLSKESAVALVGLQVLALLVTRTPLRTGAVAIAPFAALAAMYFGVGWLARRGNHHFSDGTFSLTAPFLIVALHSIARMFWIWGFAAVAVLVILRRKQFLPLLGIALSWATITLLPYSFLLYMTRVPSRHTYLPSVGLALVVGAAFVVLCERFWPSHRALIATAVLAMIVHNVGYIWTRKQQQFIERAQPTEVLMSLAKQTEGPITIECFPFPKAVAKSAVRLGAGSNPDRLRFVDTPGCREWRYVADDSRVADPSAMVPVSTQ